MPLRIYNTLTKKEEDFVPLKGKEVTMYTCGPTVYGRPHIGNYASFMMADLLRRWLEVSGFNVTHAKNITDVGHLLHDSDSGDDKVQKEAEKEKVHPLDVARRYEKEFLEDEKALNMKEPEHRPRASEFVPQMIAMTKKLLEKGNAYETEDAIYFSVESFPAYGKLSGNTLDQLDAGARVEVNDQKKHPADFALWKKCVGENAAHILRWSYASGEVVKTTGDDPAAGFPGWHIECSVMSSSLLGEQIDVHTGGEDNIFPHHECEIAQSECASGKPFVKYWLHRRRIDMGKEKMSKSLGNVLSLPDIVAMGFSPLDLRYYFLSVHYRTNLKFTEKGLVAASIARSKIVDWVSRKGNRELSVREGLDPVDEKQIEGFINKFIESMNSDLNTPAALASIFECMNYVNSCGDMTGKAVDLASSFAQMIRDTFGCFDSKPEPKPEPKIPDDVQKLCDEREVARKNKDFAESDRLRDEIKKKGYEVRDKDGGYELKPMM